jgi:hypothetical protein
MAGTDDDRHFVVTGAGRCGTHWFQEVLQTHLGIPTGHEQVLAPWTDGAFLEWQGLRGDCAWPAVVYLRGEVPRSTPILHLVRDPLAMVRSRMGRNKLSDRFRVSAVRQFAFNVRPDIPRDAVDDFGRAILMVSRWDRFCTDEIATLGFPQLCVRIEEVSTQPALFRAVVEFLVGQVVSLDECRAILDRMSPDVGRHNRAPVEWADIHRHPNGHELVALAESHGYPTS